MLRLLKCKSLVVGRAGTCICQLVLIEVPLIYMEAVTNLEILSGFDLQPAGYDLLQEGELDEVVWDSQEKVAAANDLHPLDAVTADLYA
jgi:hypothetical protein